MEVLFEMVSYIDELESKKMSLILQMPDCFEVLYGLLDHSDKGFVSNSDFRRLAHSLGIILSFDEVATLIADHTDVSTPLDLSLGNLARMAWPHCSAQHQMLGSGTTNADVKSVLYLLKFSVACPGCGSRIQRFGSEGCPNVRCPICRADFPCGLIVEDGSGIEYDMRPRDPAALSNAHFRALQDFLEISVRNACALEALRRQIAARLWGGSLRDLLCDVFFELTREAEMLTPSVQLGALRAFGVMTGRQSDLLFDRFDKRGRGFVTVQDFVDELCPKVFA